MECMGWSFVDSKRMGITSTRGWTVGWKMRVRRKRLSPLPYRHRADITEHVTYLYVNGRNLVFY